MGHPAKAANSLQLRGRERAKRKDNAEAQSSQRNAEEEKDEEGFLASQTSLGMTGLKAGRHQRKVKGADREIGVPGLGCAGGGGFGALGDGGFDVIVVGAGDYFELDVLGAGGFALAYVGAVGEAFDVHLVDHG